MRIKGVFWREGVNGLGVRLPLVGVLPLPYRKRFDWAARRHDEDYDFGGDGWWRRRADINFLWRMVAASETDLQVAVAVVYFAVVRGLGWMFYRYLRE